MGRPKFGIWKRDKETKARIYVALDGTILRGREAYERALADKKLRNPDAHIIDPADLPVVDSQLTPIGSGGNEQDALDAALRVGKTKRELDPARTLEAWKIPAAVCAVYAGQGVTTMYDWQVECLKLPGVISGARNLVYSAPTSGGKTLVSELLLLKRVVIERRKALFILPYVSIVNEKVRDLQAKFAPIGLGVRAYHAQAESTGGLLPASVDIAVCTIEKANSIVNHLLEEGRLKEICCVVVDEIHMLEDSYRGYLLELLLTKLRMTQAKAQRARSKEGFLEGILASPKDEKLAAKAREASNDSLQIVGMSATLPNIADLARWLDAELYVTDFRPVPLKQYLKVGTRILDADGRLVRTIPRPPVAARTARQDGKPSDDPDQITELCEEVTRDGNSVLVFCATKDWCRKCANMIAYQLGHRQMQRLAEERKELGVSSAPLPAHPMAGHPRFQERQLLCEQLRQLPDGIDDVLETTIPFGVAYHHAGMTIEERNLIEDAFRTGVLNILVATSTLAAGVNLPARRVIFRSPYVGTAFLEPYRYQQMSGRAGRTGKDEAGESIVICKPEDQKRVLELMKQPLRPLSSALQEGHSGLRRAILEAIASGAAKTEAEVREFISFSLLAFQHTQEKVSQGISSALSYLTTYKFIEASGEELHATLLGQATFASGLSPDEAFILYKELDRARRGLVLSSSLHLCYHLAPIYTDIWPDWHRFFLKYGELVNSPHRRVLEKLEISEQFLVACTYWPPSKELHLQPFQLPPPITASAQPSSATSPALPSAAAEASSSTATGEEKALNPGATPTTPALPAPAASPSLAAARPFVAASPLLPRPSASSSSSSSAADRELVLRYRRLWAGLMLLQLVEEDSLEKVAQDFDVSRGELQRLQTDAATFASMVAVFCERLHWRPLALLIAHFADRISFGAKSELLPLMRIPGVKAYRARLLYNAGLTTVEKIAAAGVQRVHAELSRFLPFSSHYTEGKQHHHYYQRQQQQASTGSMSYRAHKLKLELEIARRIVQGARELLAAEAAKTELSGTASSSSSPEQPAPAAEPAPS